MADLDINYFNLLFHRYYSVEDFYLNFIQ